MISNKELGKKLITEAERIYKWELNTAIENEDWNLAVRRAQEIVELSLKGALKFLGVDYPKVHDVGYVFIKEAKNKGMQLSEDNFMKIQEASKWLTEARASAFYAEKNYSKDDALRAYEDAVFVIQTIKNVILRSLE
jgi:HEPN domain-containing protein